MYSEGMKDAGLDELAAEINGHLAAIRRRLREPIESDLARGVTVPQRMVMETVLGSAEGLSLKDLAGQVGLAHSTVSGIVDRLAAKGLLRRETDGSDRRVTRIVASEPVRTFMKERMPELLMSPLRGALGRVSEDEQRVVMEGLRVLRRAVEG